MSDATATAGAVSPHATDRARKRARQRAFADFRLRVYGVAAICVAALALVALLWSVVYKASFTVFEYATTLEVEIPSDAFDTDAAIQPYHEALFKQGLMTRDEVVGKVYRADTGKAIAAAVETAIGPGAAREGVALLSSASMDDLTRRAQSGEIAPGTRLAGVEALLSDDAQLYLKGASGRLRRIETGGALSLDGDSGVVKAFAGGNDFVGAVIGVKESLREQVAELRRDADAQERGARIVADRAAALEGEAAKEAAAQIAAYRAERDRLTTEADAIDARATAPGGVFALTPDMPSFFVHANGDWIVAREVAADRITGEAVAPLSGATTAAPGDWALYAFDTPQAGRKLSDPQIAMLETLKERGAIEKSLNTRLLGAPNSREAELAGIWGAVAGSFWTMLVTFLLAFPIGVAAAIYLEEFAPRNRLTDLIEVNINNLAAVPSIVFGLLGLAVFLGFFGLPRSAPLVGGIVLALMTLPTIIIASRASIRAVPPSIRDAALGLGASRTQTVWHHVLPLALPGMLTGSIIGMAQALGETAPLLLIGMVAFIVRTPQGVTDPASVLPVQVFQWADLPERMFEHKTAAAILVLLLFLATMNAIAVVLRRKLERRW